jgi:Response regulator containing CheY-like receiver, AAA-type ATPase, and DNA-binding domains
MTAYSDTEKAVLAIKAGATDFISKPWEKEKLLATVFSAIKLIKSQKEVDSLKNKIEALSYFNSQTEIIGESQAMLDVF